MHCESYFLTSNKGEVIICPNEERASLWDLWIDGQLIRPAFYSSPEEAALRAHERDFGDEELNKVYVGLRVSSDLSQWKQGRRSKSKISIL